MVLSKMSWWLLLSKINCAFYRLQVWMVSQEIATVVMCNVCVTPCAIDPVHAHVRHDRMSITRYEISLTSSELIVPRYL